MVNCGDLVRADGRIIVYVNLAEQHEDDEFLRGGELMIVTSKVKILPNGEIYARVITRRSVGWACARFLLALS